VFPCLHYTCGGMEQEDSPFTLIPGDASSSNHEPMAPPKFLEALPIVEPETITGQLRKILKEVPKDKQDGKTFARRIAERLATEALKRGGKAAVRAIAEIADRTEGRPAQRLELGSSDGTSGLTINIRRVE